MKLPINLLLAILLSAYFTNGHAAPFDSGITFSMEQKHYRVNGKLNVWEPKCKDIPIQAKIVESYYTKLKQIYVPLKIGQKSLIINNSARTRLVSEYVASGKPTKARAGYQLFSYEWTQVDTKPSITNVKAWVRDNRRTTKKHEKIYVHKRFKLIISSKGTTILSSPSFTIDANGSNTKTISLRSITKCP